MSKNEEIIFKLKEVMPQKGERTKTLAGKISSLLIQLPALVKYINEPNSSIREDIFYDLGRYISYQKIHKGKIIQHIYEGDNYFYMIVTGKVAKIGVKYKRSHMSFREYILHLTKLQILDEHFLISDCIEKNKEIFPFKIEKNMVKLFQQIQVFDFNEELKKLIDKINNSKWEEEHENIEDFLNLINPEFLYGKEYFLSKEMKFPVLIPHYYEKEILGPNSFIGYLYKSKGIKELSAYICINNTDILYLDKSILPLGCKLINIYAYKLNSSLIENIFKKYIIFENTSLDYLTKNYSNYFQIIPIKKGEKLVSQNCPHEGLFFVNKGGFQLRTKKSYYELQELIFSLRDSLDTFKNYISYIKKRELDDLNDKLNDLKSNSLYKHPLFVIKASEKKDIIFSTYHAPQIIGLNEFYDIKTGINHFSLYCITEEAEVYFLPNELVNNLLSIDSIYKCIAHIVEEKVQSLIFGIKKYKSLYEEKFIKFFALPKLLNNDNNNELNEKKNNTLIIPPLLSQNNDKDNLRIHQDENYNIRKKKPIQINNDNSRYNIIKKKLLNLNRNKKKQNLNLRNDSINLFSVLNLKENKLSSANKNQNKSVSYLESNTNLTNLNLAISRNDILKYKKKLSKITSNLDIKKNNLNIINKNKQVDKNFSHSFDIDTFSPINNNYTPHFEKKKLIKFDGFKLSKDNPNKIKLKSISNIKLNQINKIKPLINDNTKNEEFINKLKFNNKYNEELSKDINKAKDKEADDDFNNLNIKDINEKNINLNTIDNIYNNFSLDKMKLYIVKGKRVTLRNSLANEKDIRLFQKLNNINPMQPPDSYNNNKKNDINKLG